MVSVRPISEIDIAEEGCFAFLPPSQTVSISYNTMDGPVPYVDFSAFEHSAGTVLRFETMLIESGTPWSMTAVLDDGTEHVIHWPTYEDNPHAWGLAPSRPHQFFGFMKSVSVNEDNSLIRAFENRCDARMLGPRRYYPTDGISPSEIDFSLFTQENASQISAVMSVDGTAHLITMNVHGINMSWRNWPMVTLIGKTMSGLIKQLSEWQKLYKLGIAEEDFAQDADSFLTSLGITESMIDELEQTEVMMPTERFMRGYGNPRHGFTETGVMPDSLKNHLMGQLRYKTISSLEINHPSKPSFSDDIKSKERRMQQNNLLKFAYEFMPQVSIESITTQHVYDIIYGNQTSHQLSTVRPTPLQEPIYRNGLFAARYFDATQ